MNTRETCVTCGVEHWGAAAEQLRERMRGNMVLAHKHISALEEIGALRTALTGLLGEYRIATGQPESSDKGDPEYVIRKAMDALRSKQPEYQ